MAIKEPTWIYKSKGDKQTASEMNELAQAVIINATELSNTKYDVASLINNATGLDNRITTIEESGPINQADDDDLENAIINGAPVIREKTTKTYRPETYSGMGRVILRKSMVNGVNVLTQEMINQANTIYEIRYDFDLNGAGITIPEGCVLDFQGGSLSNGTTEFNNTFFEGKINIQTNIVGTVANKCLNLEWFGIVQDKVNSTDRFQDIINLYASNVPGNPWDLNMQDPEPIIIIPFGTLEFDNSSVNLRSYITIKGQGRGSTVLKNIQFKSSSSFNMTFSDFTLKGNATVDKETAYNVTDADYCGFYLYNCARVIFNNVNFSHYDIGVKFYDTYLSDFYSCFVTYCNIGYYYNGRGSGFGGHAVNFYGGEIYNCRDGIRAGLGNGVLLSGLTIENNYYGINIESNGSGLMTIDGCYFEGHVSSIYGYCSNKNIINNHFAGDSSHNMHFVEFVSVTIKGNTIPNPRYSEEIYHVFLEENSFVSHHLNTSINNNHATGGNRLYVSDNLSVFLKDFDTAAKLKSVFGINDSDGSYGSISLSNFANDLNTKLPIASNSSKGLMPNNTLGIMQQSNSYFLNKVFKVKLSDEFGIVSINIRHPYNSFFATVYVTNSVSGNNNKWISKGVESGWYLYTDGHDIYVTCKTVGANYLHITPITPNGVSLEDVSNVISINDLADGSRFMPITESEGSTTQRPISGYKGMEYFDTTLNKPVWWTGSIWSDSNGNDVNIKTSGVFANKPISPPIGFSYLCIDKQTTEGATNGIMIYHKGNNVWVDALGRVIS